MEYALSHAQLVSHGQLEDEQREEMKGWLERLRELDPMRMGRWDDVQKSLGL
jgi:geranylgeranyl transferase type-2 subunit alpha